MRCGGGRRGGLGELAEGVQAGTAGGLGEGVLGAAAVARGADEREQCVGVDPLVPDGEFAEPRQSAHVVAVRGDGGEGGEVGLLVGVAVVAGGDGCGGGEAFDVPLEGSRVRLVEVVEVEEQGAVRRGEQSEVQQVGIAAELDGEARVGCRREVARHHGGGAAQEGERARRHPPVADGQQVAEPVGALPLQGHDGVGAVGGRDPRAVRGAGAVLAGPSALVGAFGGAAHGGRPFGQ